MSLNPAKIRHRFPVSQDGVPNDSQTLVRDEVEILDVMSPHQEG